VDRESDLFRRVAFRSASIVGSHWAFMAAVIVVLGWAVTGPIFHYSDTWQLVINTGTTIVTFLMVFLIQASQNRDGKAIQLKLDELIRAQKRARNVFANIEEASEQELDRFHDEFKQLRKGGVPGREAAERAARNLTRSDKRRARARSSPREDTSATSSASDRPA
jgi:low affinity Fe/Cu permease